MHVSLTCACVALCWQCFNNIFNLEQCNEYGAIHTPEATSLKHGVELTYILTLLAAT